MLSTHNFVSENGFFVIGKVLSLFYSPVDSRGYNYYDVRVKRSTLHVLARKQSVDISQGQKNGGSYETR